VDEAAPIELGSFPIAVYGAMFAATVAGQFVGFGLDAALGRRLLWVPIACSALLEAVVGARFAASRVARAMAVGDWGRLSAYYSGALALLSVPLALWTAAAQSSHASSGGAGGGVGSPATLLGLSAGVLVMVTLLRWGLMTVLSPRRIA
jgi:hypothetical protein